MMFAPSGVPYGAAYGELVRENPKAAPTGISLDVVIPIALWTITSRQETSSLLTGSPQEAAQSVLIAGVVPAGRGVRPAHDIDGFLGYVPLIGDHAVYLSMMYGGLPVIGDPENTTPQ